MTLFAVALIVIFIGEWFSRHQAESLAEEISSRVTTYADRHRIGAPPNLSELTFRGWFTHAQDFASFLPSFALTLVALSQLSAFQTAPFYAALLLAGVAGSLVAMKLGGPRYVTRFRIGGVSIVVVIMAVLNVAGIVAFYYF